MINKGKISYSYEAYLECIKLTKQLEKENKNYTPVKNKKAPFRNIQIRMKMDSWVFISKKKSPSIHFAVFHPNLVDAIWDFNPMNDP